MAMSDHKNNGKIKDTRFKKGMRRLPGAGRKPGVPNRLTVALKDAIITAAELAGHKQIDEETGKYTCDGEGGLTGYMHYLALHREELFTPLLGKVLPMHVTPAVVQNRVYRTEEEVRALCVERGVPFEEVAALGRPVPIKLLETATVETEDPVDPM
jgi:hypothetical protein